MIRYPPIEKQRFRLIAVNHFHRMNQPVFTPFRSGINSAFLPKQRAQVIAAVHVYARTIQLFIVWIERLGFIADRPRAVYKPIMLRPVAGGGENYALVFAGAAVFAEHILMHRLPDCCPLR